MNRSAWIQSYQSFYVIAFLLTGHDIRRQKKEPNMGWHVRYIDRSLKHELLSPEFATREEAFESAWTLAQQENDITAVEGPDEELVSMEAIGAWFDGRSSREKTIGAKPVRKQRKGSGKAS
jgi:hypothetical protein